MYFCLLDTLVKFAEFIVSVENVSKIDGKISNDIDNNKIICYSQIELDSVKNTLNKLKCNYVVEQQFISMEVIKKVQGIKFKNKNEVKKYIFEDIEPESEKLPRLMKENSELKQRLTQSENALLTVMFGRK